MWDGTPEQQKLMRIVETEALESPGLLVNKLKQMSSSFECVRDGVCALFTRELMDSLDCL